VLVGGEGWAVELSLDEARGLCAGAQRLIAELACLADQLMPEERVALELEAGPVWLELDGQPGSLALRFVLQPAAGSGSRGVEGCWSVAATTALLAVWQQQPQLAAEPASSSSP
jgi:hypothetical protein